MATSGAVREWYAEEGWGVIETAETPGGCWAHHSAVQTAGYRSLEQGALVEVEWEPARQDGFSYRATRVWPAGEPPYTDDRSAGDPAAGLYAAYSSGLTLTLNGGAPASIAAMTAEHWPQVRDIYAAGIATGHATFESEPPTWERFDESRLAGQRLVVTTAGGCVLGWTAASAASDRCAYSGVVEHAVYVDPAATGRSIGRLLLAGLIASTEAAGIWTIQSGIFPENAASLALHAASGFRVVGVRERVGKMTYGPLAGQWRDVVAVERRSPRIV